MQSNVTTMGVNYLYSEKEILPGKLINVLPFIYFVFANLPYLNPDRMEASHKGPLQDHILDSAGVYVPVVGAYFLGTQGPNSTGRLW